MSRRSSIISGSELKRPDDGTKDDIVSAGTETVGEVFDDSIIDLVRDAQTGCPHLLFRQDKTGSLGVRINHRGKVYVPPQLEASLLRSLVLPAGTADYGKASKLFEAINSVFLKAGFPPGVSDTTSFFVFSSWFPDLLPEPPCLLITGARPEGLHLLQLLAPLARRALPPLLAQNITSLAAVLLPRLSPTLLINAETLRHAKLAAWLASGERSSNVIARGKIVNLCTARAIFVGEASETVPSELPILMVNAEPSNGPLPTASPDERSKLALEFQPQLLEYRLRNFAKVRDSTADLPGAPAVVRILARILCASVADAPELQVRARGVLEHQRQAQAKRFWLDPRALVVEAALARCHEPKRQEIRVGELTADVLALFASRGQQRDVEPRKVGAILDSVGISRERFRDGYILQFTDEVRQRLHRLARVYEIPVTQESAAKCAQCLASITAEDSNGGVALKSEIE
jgi:hypothetical protein